jgi:hypothetical protein
MRVARALPALLALALALSAGHSRYQLAGFLQ